MFFLNVLPTALIKIQIQENTETGNYMTCRMLQMTSQERFSASLGEFNSQ